MIEKIQFCLFFRYILHTFIFSCDFRIYSSLQLHLVSLLVLRFISSDQFSKLLKKVIGSGRFLEMEFMESKFYMFISFQKIGIKYKKKIKKIYKKMTKFPQIFAKKNHKISSHKELV